MKTIKSHNFDSLLEKELKNKNFKEAFESFNEEFTLAKEIIKLRKTNHLTQKELALKVGTSLESKFIIDFTLKSFIGFGKSVFNTNFLPSDKKSKSLYVYNNFP